MQSAKQGGDGENEESPVLSVPSPFASFADFEHAAHQHAELIRTEIDANRNPATRLPNCGLYKMHTVPFSAFYGCNLGVLRQEADMVTIALLDEPFICNAVLSGLPAIMDDTVLFSMNITSIGNMAYVSTTSRIAACRKAAFNFLTRWRRFVLTKQYR